VVLLHLLADPQLLLLLPLFELPDKHLADHAADLYLPLSWRLLLTLKEEQSCRLQLGIVLLSDSLVR